MAKSSTRRVTIYINGKEAEASVIFGFFVFSPPPKPPPMNRHRPYHLMNPLTGIWPAYGNARGYRYASPDGDGFPVTYSVTHSHTDHSSLITLHSSYTFSAKEKDSETGLSYFGARYYSSDLSIWLSVDPMASKYPSLSPYVYCADNPVKLVDPNGEEYDVFITGEGAEWVTKQLSDSYQGLNITRDKFGRLHTNVDDISSLSEDEKLIYDAINSNTVIVNMLVGETDYVQTSMGNFEINMSAAFGGNVLSDDKSMAFTSQFINKKKVIQNYYSNARGKLIAHELTESYLGGLLSIERQFHASPAEWIKGQDPYYYNDFYRISHDNAISQPYNKSEIRNMFCNTFNCSTLMYDLFIEKRIRP
ncbi:MAG: RHS repeat-associated core domain-containing protein [Bacteroidales bacterium]|nr:RHS repeat-associated core domain-containing protein [Bacteroidales bacterium]